MIKITERFQNIFSKSISIFLLVVFAAGCVLPPAEAATKKKKKETSSDVRRRQEKTRKEIKLTEEQIRANDAAVKKKLSELGRIEGDIRDTKKRVSEADSKVKALGKQIYRLQTRITADEKRISTLRSEYLKAVKKMRAKKKESSMLAFIFSSGSFNEAARRMRYLRQFSEWRDKQTAEISERVARLKTDTEKLSQAKSMHDRELAVQMKAQETLQTQFAKQNTVVTELKQNGEALKAHLLKKQAEANALNSKILALIAAEQRQAEAERQARERAEKEREAQLAEQKRKADEARAKAERGKLEAANRESKETAKKETPRKDASERKPVKKESPKKESPKKEAKKRKTQKKNQDVKIVTPAEKEVSYAEARRRKPRRNQEASNSTAGSAAKSGGGFEKLRGSLPRPVAGAFKVTSRFGRQSIPDMPNITYENPGIDAEVAPGASAQAVCDGKVSGVYMVPGYNTVVIVNHDGYYTVYGNIAASGVKVGDSVKQGQALGRLALQDDDESHSLIHFEVWKNREKLDPLGWIK